MTRMRIGHFVSLFPVRAENEDSQVYGAGRVCYHLCKQLSMRGHLIHVFIPYKENFMEKEGNLFAHFYGSQLKISTMFFSYELFFDPLNYPLDIAHVHSDMPISAASGLRYTIKKKKPLVVTWHGDWILNYGNIVRKVGVFLSNRFLIKELLSRANLIVTPSIHYVQESRFLKEYADKLVEIPNGIELHDFKIPFSKDECRKILGIDESKRVVLFVGAIYPLKGPHILLGAASRIVNSYRDVLFVFVGGGNLDKYKELARRLNIQRYVKFTGYVKERQKILYYYASDIFVLPSIETFEVFPLVLLEASACGLPIIVSDLNTFKCIIEEGYNGFFVRRGDTKNLAETIAYLLENENLRKKMGENARKKAENYSWKKIAEKYEKIYERLIS